MSSVNRVHLLGRAGTDPEVKYLANGDAVVNVSVATSRNWKDKKTGDKMEETEWSRCVAYGRTAEVIAEYLKKGELIYFEGRLKTRKWQDKQHVDHYTTEIIVESMQLIGKTQPRGDGERQQSRPAPAPAPRQAARTQPSIPFDDMDSDIPF